MVPKYGTLTVSPPRSFPPAGALSGSVGETTAAPVPQRHVAPTYCPWMASIRSSGMIRFDLVSISIAFQ
jgi:hypothetical protein